MSYSMDDQGRVWHGPSPADEERIRAAEAERERQVAALIDFPEFGFYVHTGLAGYGADLEPDDMPARSWEDVASQIAWELSSAADFLYEGVSITEGQARELYDVVNANPDADADAWKQVAEQYHEADDDRRLAGELDNLRGTFEVLARSENPPPLYDGHPELRHARIWDIITSQFPLDISDNTRLYVFECEEDPGDDEDPEG